MSAAEGPPRASVVICTWNGAARIGAALEALAQQRGEAGFEVVVVDNASTDGTAQVVAQHPATALLRAAGRAVRIEPEPRQGLTWARLRGARSARAAVLCFVDDDNLVSPDFVSRAVELLDRAPQVGLLVARVFPVFERPPPPSLARRLHLLAVNDALGAAPVVWTDDGLAPTIGAGLCVRRAACLAALEAPGPALPDRVGATLSGGGDIELGLRLARAGWHRRYSPELEVRHLIPASRTRTRYVLRLIRGVVSSERELAARYGLTVERRASAIARLSVALAAAPALALVRRDGLREAACVLADRLARVRRSG